MASTPTFFVQGAQRRQLGTLGAWVDASDGLRVTLEWDDSKPDEVRDVTAAVVVGGWVFERSMVPRQGPTDPFPGRVISGALRLGDLVWRPLLPDCRGMSDGERAGALRDINDVSREVLDLALRENGSRRETPTARQRRKATGRMNKDATRAVMEPLLTTHEVGNFYDCGGAQLRAWGLDAGPLGPQGQRRVTHDDENLVVYDTPERRRQRDRTRALATTHRTIGT